MWLLRSRRSFRHQDQPNWLTTYFYGIDNAIHFVINLKVEYCYYNCYSTIFGYDISHCLRLLTWLCRCLFLLFMHLTMTLLWLCVDYSINHWMTQPMNLGLPVAMPLPTIFDYESSHCLWILKWLCHLSFSLFMQLTLTLLWLCIDYSINHWMTQPLSMPLSMKLGM